VGVLLLEEARDGLDLSVVHADEGACRALGYREAELRDMDVQEVVVPEERQRFRQLLEDLLHAGAASMHVSCREAGGTTVPALLQAWRLPLPEQRMHVLTLQQAEQPCEPEDPAAHKGGLYRNLLDGLPDFAFVKDREHRYVLVNSGYARFMGMDPAEVVGRTDFDLLPRKVAESCRKTEARAWKHAGRYSVEVRLFGRVREFRMFRISLPDGRPAMAGLVRDVTSKRRNMDVLRDCVYTYRLLAENVADIVWMMDRQCRLIYISPSIERVCGLTPEEAKQAAARDWDSSPFLLDIRRMIGRILDAERAGGGDVRPQKTESRMRRRDGSRFWTEVTVIPSLDDRGCVQRFVGSVRDIQESMEQRETLKRLALYDGLTGLPNRPFFHNQLRQALARAQRSGERIGVLCLDVDRLKAVNDTMGHGAGDQAIREVGGRLTKAVREMDTVARLHGDEFMCLLQNLESVQDARTVAARIQEEMRRPLYVNGHEVFIGLSIGMSMYPDCAGSMEDLLKQADVALYNAKRSGHPKVWLYAREDDWLYKFYAMDRDLRKAVTNQEFHIRYQPVVQLSSNRIVLLEALLRWERPGGGVPPSEFIPILEENGLIHEIGKWLLESVCSQIAEWRSRGFPLVRISANISDKQIRDRRFLTTVERCLNKSGLEPVFLELELTESAFKENLRDSIKHMHILNDWGVTISIDDFGTGYSSLRHLLHFPLEKIKIDRSFIQNIPGDSEYATMVRAIIAMAHNLNKTVVAEGVETTEQALFLRENNCDYAQGSLFCGPQTVLEIEDMLLRGHPGPTG
jgi:diguanylate cyclase (GGDEF)-like protein/PAS domain S-box-containing protein